MQSITPYLWFNNSAQEAVDFYISVFPDAEIISTTNFGEGEIGEPGTVKNITFRINGQNIIAFNGGAEYQFTEAFSFYVIADTQQEIDHLYEELSKGGEKYQAGWLRDRFRVSWQIVPAILSSLLMDEDAEKVKKVNEALAEMKKISIQALTEAYNAE